MGSGPVLPVVVQGSIQNPTKKTTPMGKVVVIFFWGGVNFPFDNVLHIYIYTNTLFFVVCKNPTDLMCKKNLVNHVEPDMTPKTSESWQQKDVVKDRFQ